VWLVSGYLALGHLGSPRNHPSAQEAVEAPAGSIDDALAVARRSRTAMKGISDYTAMFAKTERVGEQVIEQTMELKIREKPFSVYLSFRGGKSNGREVVYVADANDGYTLVREKGLLKSLAGTVKLKPDDPKIMGENRYALVEIGIGKIVEKAIAAWEQDKQLGSRDVKVRIDPGRNVGSIACDCVEIVRRTKRSESPFQISRVWFDKTTKLPVQAEQYGWPGKAGDEPPLLERYSYTDVETNVGLTDDDFDHRNPKYGFAGGRPDHAENHEPGAGRSEEEQ
jgi:outer membrane lipoprotein-sorting protein